MSEPADQKTPVGDEKAPVGDLHEVEKHSSHIDHAADLDADAKLASFKADAIEAENAEQNMTVLQALKQYPMAALWAFIMSSTIVSF